MADGQTNGALMRAPIHSGAHVAAIIPQTFDDAWRVAGALAASGLTSFKRHEEALAAIMAGAEVGLPPFASLQSFMFVNGRLAMWGDAQLALVLSRGHKVEEWYEGTLEAGDLTAWTKITRADSGVVVLDSFSIEDAKRAELWQTNARVRRKNKQTGEWYEAANDSPWYRYPKRMLKYRARGFVLRDGASDVLRGIKMVEEVQDYPQLEDVPMQARVVGASAADDYDQRPAEERPGKYGVIGGQAGKDVYDDLAQRMSDCEDAAALEIVFDEAEKANLSQNRMFALSEHYEACKEALEDGRACPPAPRFSEPPEPSPFEALNAEGEKAQTAEAFKAWTAKLTPETLGKCSDEERAKLKATHAAAKERATKSGRAAGKSEDAEAAKAGDGKPGGEPAPASSSLFESLKQQCLDCLKAKTPRRALAAWRKEADEAADKLTADEQAQLDQVEKNVREELTK
ncbi:MAG: hypothetical protein KJZ75_11505 [Hyphomonadaceae bacterium]|nr:hypothetical protein [Hyphomonadaceae bacterium]